MGCVTVKDPKTHKSRSQPNLIFLQVLLVLILVALSPNAHGDSSPISTDRILQTNSPDILQPGYYQLETGFYSYETDRENNIKSKHTLLNNNLYRIGFREKMELRVALYGYNIQHASSGNDNGLSDAELSTKVLLFDSSANRPKTTLNAGFTLPIGNDAFTSNKVDPFFSFIPSFSNLLPDSIYNDNSLGVTWNDSNADFKITNDHLIITPKKDFNGYIFVDLKLDMSFMLKVVPVNDIPFLAEIEPQSVEEDTEFSLNLFA